MRMQIRISLFTVKMIHLLTEFILDNYDKTQMLHANHASSGKFSFSQRFYSMSLK